MKHRYLLLAAAVMGLAADMSALADPPPWAPAHGRRGKEVVEVRPVVRDYRYIYYPAYQVYYAPEQQLWFWMSGGNWQFGMNLPLEYSRYSYATNGVTIMLNSDRPYVEHTYVEQTYGRPWRAEHGFKDKDNGNHGNHGKGKHGHRD